MKSMNEINAELSHCSGTEQYYHGLNKRSIYTDGAQALFELAGAYWLYDIIQTKIWDVLRKKAPETYTFTITSENGKADLVLKDYLENILWKRHINYTDFPEGSKDLIVGFDGERIITCLLSEN